VARFKERVAAALVEATEHAAYPSLLGIEVALQALHPLQASGHGELLSGVGTMHGARSSRSWTTRSGLGAR
jgi:hypothetical protein